MHMTGVRPNGYTKSNQLEFYVLATRNGSSVYSAGWSSEHNARTIARQVARSHGAGTVVEVQARWTYRGISLKDTVALFTHEGVVSGAEQHGHQLEAR